MRSDVTPAIARPVRPAAPPAWLPGPMRPGYDAARRNLRPFLLIQACAVGLLIAYYQSPAVRAACDRLVAVMQGGGLPAAGVVGAVAGGVLPELAKVVALGDRRFDRARLGNVAFATAYFFIAGVMVDLFYRGQALLFGDGTDLGTSVRKMLFDQFVYSVVWAVPFAAVMFCWKANGLSVARTWRDLNDRFVARRVMPVLLPAWAYWIPMNTITYLLPVPVQFLMFAFALAAWSLILTVIATGEGKAEGGGRKAE